MTNKELVATASDKDDEIFVIYIVLFTGSDLDYEIYPSCKAEIVILKTDKYSIIIFFRVSSFYTFFHKLSISQTFQIYQDLQLYYRFD